MVAETSLRDRRSKLLAEPGLKGQEFCRRYAAEADAWLSGLAERAAGDNKRHLALIAVGATRPQVQPRTRAARACGASTWAVGSFCGRG